MAHIDWDEVKARHSLASVARRTGLDVPAAGNVMVCCPMPDHDDSRPSMHLDLDKNLYRCYGCDVHGDVVQWVRDLEGVKAGEAVEILDSGHPSPECSRTEPFGPRLGLRSSAKSPTWTAPRRPVSGRPPMRPGATTATGHSTSTGWAT